MPTPTESPNRIHAQLPIRKKRAGKPRGSEIEVELGASGTVNMSGIVAPIENVPALVMPQGIDVYHQMRNLAQVQASLLLVQAPILSSTPIVRPPKDGDNVDQGIADFCHQALFAPGAMQISWSRVFQHLITRFDFGVSVLEKVWRYHDETGTYRLAKLAPRLARTLVAWPQDPLGNLAGVEQQASGTNGRWINVTIPANKIVVSTYRREGDDYWGRSLLRGAHIHWFALMELFRMDLVRADRWSVGIAKAKFTTTEAWMDAKLVNQVKRALKALRSHERAYVMEHPSVEFSVMGPGAGSTGSGVSLKESIETHERGVIQNVLGTFLTSGSDGMNSNRTSKLADVFSSMLELGATEMAEDLTHQVVRELCDLNFAMEGREYPSIAFTNIADDDIDALTSNLTRVSAVGAYRPGRADHEHFRKLLKLPAVDPDAMDLDDDTDDEDEDEDDNEPMPPKKKTGATPNADDGEDDPDDEDEAKLRAKTRDDVLLSRVPNDLEVLLLRSPEQLARSLNQAADDLETRLMAIRRDQADTLLAKIVKRDASTRTNAFTDLRPGQFAIPQAGLTERAIRDMQRTLFAQGRREVRQELARQGASISLRMTSDEMENRILLGAPKRKKSTAKLPETSADANRVLITTAKVTAEQLNDTWFNRVLEVASRLRRGGTTGPTLVREVWETLENELSSGLWGKARAKINETFSLGRAVEARVHEDEIDRAVWSCLLDVHSCEPCVKRDGIEAAVTSEEYLTNPVPYKGCDGNKGGGDACRCMWLFILKTSTV
jgi:hypothetical protein